MSTEMAPTAEKASEPAPSTNGGAPSGKSKRVIVRSVFAVVAVVAAVFGYNYYQYTQTWEETDDAFIEGHVIQISPKVTGYVAKLAITDNQHVNQGELLVQIDPRDFQARVDQAQANLQAAEARQVAAQTTIELTDRTAAATFEQATAGLAGAKAAVDTAKAVVQTNRYQENQKKAQVAVANAAVEEAKANATATDAEAVRSKLEWQRYKELRGTNAVTQQQVDNAEAAYRAAQARLDAANKAITLAEAQVVSAAADGAVASESLRQAEFRLVQVQAQQKEAEAVVSGANIVQLKLSVAKAELATATADIKQFQAALTQAELDLSYTRIVAPEAGRVTRRTVEAGVLVQPGQALLAVVPDTMWVIANFKETQLTHMQPGQEVRVHVDAYPDHVFKGKVDSFQRGTGARFSLLPPENATGNYVKVVQRVPVKIVFDDPPENTALLAPGMSVVPEVKVR